MKVRHTIYALLVLAGCGGKTGTIELDIVEPALVDTLAGGSKIEIIAGPDTGSSTITKLANGQGESYSISFNQKPPKTAYNLVMEVLDSTNDIVAYGETPLITLNAVNQGPFGVWLGIPGTIAASKSTLSSTTKATAGATSLTGCGITGLGGVIAGGDVAGTAVTTTYVYDVFTSAIIDTSAMTTARVGAVCVPATAKGVVFGGSSTESPLTSLATAEAFDPTSGGAGQWIAVPGTTAAAAFPSLAILSDGTGLATGGFETDGLTVSNAATAIAAGSAITIGPTAAPMTSPRVHHASAWMNVGGQAAGAILVGGLPVPHPTNSTIAEQYVNGMFTSIADGTIAPIPNLWNATATSLSAGAGVFIAGGGVDGGVATASAYYVTFNATSNNFVVTDYSKVMGLTARKNHTATLVGDDILLCGGIGADGKALGTCDVIATNPTISLTRTINGLSPRANHVAIPLETGPVLFVGGDDGNGTQLAGIDIYTPTMAEETIVNTLNGAIIGKATADGGA